MTESNLLVRCRVIRDLLARYAELVDPMQARDGSGNGVALGLMPATYSASVRELERLLRLMREHGHHVTTVGKLVPDAPRAQRDIRVSARGLWWHLNERYIAATTRTVDVPVTRRAKNGKRLQKVERRVVPAVHPVVAASVDGDETLMVRAGIALLAIGWGLSSEPMLPADLQVAA